MHVICHQCLTLFISCFLSACPPGTFKSTQGPGLCLQCPPNSRSTAEAATICVCRNGYYRGDADQPDEPCTSEYIVHDVRTPTPSHACILVGRAPVISIIFDHLIHSSVNMCVTSMLFKALCLCRRIYMSVQLQPWLSFQTGHDNHIAVFPSLTSPSPSR